MYLISQFSFCFITSKKYEDLKMNLKRPPLLQQPIIRTLRKLHGRDFLFCATDFNGSLLVNQSYKELNSFKTHEPLSCAAWIIPGT